MEKEYVVKIDSTGSTFEYGPEVVRCAECVYNRTSACSMAFDQHGLTYVWNHDDDFCSWGKKNAS